MTDELIKKARTFTAQHELSDFYTAVAFSGYPHAIDKWNETLADFAAECIRAERERVANGIKDKIELTLVSNENGAGIDLTKVLYLYIDELRGDK